MNTDQLYQMSIMIEMANIKMKMSIAYIDSSVKRSLDMLEYSFFILYDPFSPSFSTI